MRQRMFYFDTFSRQRYSQLHRKPDDQKNNRRERQANTFQTREGRKDFSKRRKDYKFSKNSLLTRVTPVGFRENFWAF